MSTPEEDTKKAGDNIAYAEAELASLKEELGMGATVVLKNEVFPKRKAFVTLRIAVIEKQLVELRKKLADARVDEEWLKRMGQSR